MDVPNRLRQLKQVARMERSINRIMIGNGDHVQRRVAFDEAKHFFYCARAITKCRVHMDIGEAAPAPMLNITG